MLTEEQNQQLTRVGPGTPVGELFRRYWHPVAAVSRNAAANHYLTDAFPRPHAITRRARRRA
jgi:hypothetical protein